MSRLLLYACVLLVAAATCATPSRTPRSRAARATNATGLALPAARSPSGPLPPCPEPRPFSERERASLLASAPDEVTGYARTCDAWPRMVHLPRGETYKTAAHICVASDGRVFDVQMRRPSDDPQGDELMTKVILRWRYQPLIVNGRAVPFCHRMGLQMASQR